MSLISLQEVSLRFGGPAVLQDVTLQVEPGERVCLIGRNGEGKSTLMALIDGALQPDSGVIVRSQGLITARLPQEIPRDLPGSVFEIVAGGLGPVVDLLERHRRISAQLELGGPPALLAELETVQHELDASGGWQALQQVDTILARLGLEAGRPFNELSGGLKRRALLGRALVRGPDLLLLDEPTNHLDIEAIVWLEEFLAGSQQTLLFVSHDRVLVRRLATRIVHLDRGSVTSWPGDLDEFERRRQQQLEAEEARQERFERKLAAEEIWIRKGIRARRTRNEGRVKALQEMRSQWRARREQLGQVNLQVSAAGASGKLVARVKGLSFAYAGRPLIRDLSTVILRGDKVGVIGPNGCGKTTLVRLLLGELAPTAGTVELGTNLQTVYFDQRRDQLREDLSVAENVADGRDQIEVGGGRRHIIGYLQDFLFPPERARSPVSLLSGGERNRLLLARLFAQPANLLVLDEPTNDLDVETLDLLEERVAEFPGTVLLVSHDRSFLNRVVTSTLAFLPDGTIGEYAGGYDDYLQQRPRPAADAPAPQRPRPAAPVPAAGPRRLAYKEARELEELPGTIETLEAERSALFARMSGPAFFRLPPAEVTAAQVRLQALETELAARYARWEELEAVREAWDRRPR